MQVFLFIDTNVHLHFRPFDEVDWATVCSCAAVTVVVPRITIRELDQQKSLNKNNHLRERARRALSRLEQYVSSPTVGAPLAVTVVHFADLPSFSLRDEGLQEGWGDDELIAAILEYRRQHADAELRLLTDDTGPRLTALAHGITPMRPPDDMRLPAELDETESRLRALRIELDTMKAARPKLSVVFLQGRKRSTHISQRIRKVAGMSEATIEAELRRQGEKYPTRHPAAMPQGGGLLTDFAAAGLLQPPPEEFARYNADRERYLREYRDFLVATNRQQADKVQGITASVAVLNVGTVPAEDVDVGLHVPDGLLVREADEEPEEPLAPRPPVLPRDAAQMALSIAMPRITLPDYSSILRHRSANVSGLNIRPTGSISIDAHVPRAKHGTATQVPPFVINFEDPSRPFGFSIEYRLLAANLPEEVTGELQVRVDPA